MNTHQSAIRAYRCARAAIAAAIVAAGVVLARHVGNKLSAARALAHTDELTGIGNRRAAMSALAHGRFEALAVCDLDEFKTVNDAHGHAVGDELLRVVADRLRVGMRGAGTVMRLGGDEFLLIWHARPADLHRSAARLRDLVGAEVAIAGIGLAPTASIGAVRAAPAAGYRCLLAAADRAMYEAKRAADHVVVTTAPGAGRTEAGRPSCPST